jgi:aspartate-semialdehyde dehydrogenase
VYQSIALVAAAGAVGRIILEQLAQREFPLKRFNLLASQRSVGTEVRFNGETLQVELLAPGAFQDVDLVIASTPHEVSKDFVPWAVQERATVVDESGYWRMDPSVPLVDPEVNPEVVDNCSDNEWLWQGGNPRTLCCVPLN